MRLSALKWATIGLSVFLAAGCSTGTTTYAGPADSNLNSPISNSPNAGRYEGSSLSGFNVIELGGQSHIIDATGREWNVEHAEQKYGMDPARFDHGLGPFAIRPVENPLMLSPSDDDYPNTQLDFAVLGVDLNGIVRAYPTWGYMAWVEIANERFGDAHVAVAF